MTELEELFEAFLRTHLEPDFARFTDEWPTEPRATHDPGMSVPAVSRWLHALVPLAAPAADALVRTFVAVAHDLPWHQTYSADDFGADFLQRYGYVELVGRRSALFCETMASGLLMFGPGIHYPDHRHPAEEIYLQVAGTAEYLMPDGSWRLTGPGEIVHNASMVWHATRTGDAPVLIAWAWRGGNPSIRSEIACPWSQTAL